MCLTSSGLCPSVQSYVKYSNVEACRRDGHILLNTTSISSSLVTVHGVLYYLWPRDATPTVMIAMFGLDT